jgi:hypothetical protein
MSESGMRIRIVFNSVITAFGQLQLAEMPGRLNNVSSPQAPFIDKLITRPETAAKGRCNYAHQ